MGQSELKSEDTERRLRTLEREVDRERRTERKQARRTVRAAPGLTPGRMALWAIGAILVLGLAVQAIRFLAHLLLLVLVVAGVWWVIRLATRRGGG